jgi:outer membrane protein assembly factor BamB
LTPVISSHVNALLVVAVFLAHSGCARPPRPQEPAIFPLGTAWAVALDGSVDPPLAVDERRLYVATRDGVLRALDRRNGGEVWRVRAPGLVSAAAGVLLVRAPDGRVTSLQPRTGGVRWTAESGVPGTQPAAIDRELVFVGGQGLAALEVAGGKVAWAAREPAIVSSGPVATAKGLLVGEADGTLRLRERTTGAIEWTFKTGGELRAPPFADETGEVFQGTSDRRLLRLAADSGKQKWRWKVGADVRSAAAVAGPLALFTSFDATLYAIQRGSGKLAWRAGLPSRPLSGALVAFGTALVACHENELIGYSLADGRPAGSLKLPAEIAATPLLHKGRVFVALRDRSVHALSLAGLEAAEPAAEAEQP